MKEHIRKYLERINYYDDINININTLSNLHKHHLLNVPFENLDIIFNRKIELDIDKIYEKIVMKKRGGICYELNGCFYYLLKELGFNPKQISGKVLDDGNYFDHLFIMVNIEDNIWLADVGFGDNFLEPIRFVNDKVQKDKKGLFKIINLNEGEYQLLKSNDGLEYIVEYTFTMDERKLFECEERCSYFQYSSNLRFRKGIICSLEREDGRISLSDNKLTVTIDGKKDVMEFEGKEKFQYYLKKLFHIDLNNV